MACEINGTVRLERAAAMALAGLPTWQWVGSDGEQGAGGTIGANWDGQVLELEWSGTYRGLDDHVEADLACAALVGEVHGQISVVDAAVSELGVLRLGGRGRIQYGSTTCVAVPQVRAWTVVPMCVDSHTTVCVRPLGAVTDVAGRGEAHMLGVGGVDRTVAAACGCGGWDDEAGRSVCASAGGDLGGTSVAPPMLAAGSAEALVEALGHAGGRGAWQTVADAAGDDSFGEVQRWYDSLHCDSDVAGALEALRGHSWGTLAASTALAMCRRGGPLAVQMGTNMADETAIGALTQLAMRARRDVRDHLMWSQVLAEVASHPSMSWTVAHAQGLDEVAPYHLAANEALGDDEVLDGLDGRVVAQAAPWRMGGELTQREAQVLGPSWRGPARGLRDVAQVAVGAQGQDGTAAR